MADLSSGINYSSRSMAAPRLIFEKLRIFWSCVWALVIHSIRVQFKTKKLGYFWELIDPIAQTAMWFIIYSLLRGPREIYDMSTFLYLATGVVGFNFFENVVKELPGFLRKNRKMTFFVNVNQMNILLAGFLKGAVNTTLVATLVFIFVSLADHGFFPADPLSVVNSCTALFLLGFAFGSFNAMVTVLVPLYDKFLSYVLNRVLFFTSGAIFPLDIMPEEVLKYVRWIPSTQGIDQLRSGWSYTYDSDFSSNGYVFGCAIFIFFFALMLNRKSAIHRQKKDA